VILFVLVWKRKPILALVVSLLFFPLLFLEFELFTPIVSGLITKPAENIIVSFSAPDAVRELVFMAHYDSKTDFWDHIQRAKVYKWIPHFFALGVLLAIFTFFTKKFSALKNKLVTALTLLVALAIVVYWGLVFLGFGGFVFLPTERDSFGAVDNGTAVVTLLALSKDINDGKVDIGDSNITIILTAGEEVTLQGADFYVKERWGGGVATPELPTYLVNLELVAQNGDMVYWKKNGVFLKFYDTDPDLAERLNSAAVEVTGKPMKGVEKYITDDSHRFLEAGIPSITIGHEGIPGMGFGGFHSPHDNLERVNLENLKIMIQTLERFIESY
jgi:hypothetical protein